MNYLILALLVILVYSEILPTLTMVFELIRVYLGNKIALIQNNTIHLQEEIEQIRSRLEEQSQTAIGFHINQQCEGIDEE